jgi:DNA polymerase-1
MDFEKLPDDSLVFCDCEGNDFIPGLTKMWLIQIAIGVNGEVEAFADQPGYRPIRDALSILKFAKKVVFHNGFGYDLFAINKLYPGTLRREQIIDTLVISRLRNASATRHSLKDLGEALGILKGEHDDFSQFSEEMVKYGVQDVKILQAAWTGQGKVPPFSAFYNQYRRACELEFYIAYIMQSQTNHGFCFDYEGAQLLEAELRQEQKNLERELQDIFPPIVHERYSDKQIDKATGKPKRLKDYVEVFNPGSRQQVGERLIAKYGWKPTELTNTGLPKIDETILGELPYPEAKAMARYLTLGKKLGMIADGDNAWLKLAVPYADDTYRIHGQVNPLGARTHRMSHFKPNVAQVDKDPKMRGLWIAGPGEVLVGVDAEGLELRMLAHYLAPYDNGFYANVVHSGDKKLGTDVHTVNMRAAGLALRDSAKTAIYATLYGAFDKKLGMVKQDDLKASGQPLSKLSLTKLGAEVRSGLESGIAGFKALTDKCKAMHNKCEALPGLDGRWIPSASDHSALNTLLQGNGAIIMKKAQCIFNNEMEKQKINFGYCATIHDEIDVACSPEDAQRVAEIGKFAISQAGIELQVRCPLVGDAKIGRTWHDIH